MHLIEAGEGKINGVGVEFNEFKQSSLPKRRLTAEYDDYSSGYNRAKKDREREEEKERERKSVIE